MDFHGTDSRRKETLGGGGSGGRGATGSGSILTHPTTTVTVENRFYEAPPGALNTSPS